MYDRQGDAHFDVISAFIKSIRGSDPDATLFWLARMLEAGEDARYIARRMIVHASEDIGLADPRALLVATAAAQAVEYVGLPEARLNLAEAAIYLARAPKSNSVIVVARQGAGGRGVQRARSRCTCATRTTRAPPGSDTARATSTRTTTRATRSSRSTGPPGSRGTATTSPRARARRPAGDALTGRSERPGYDSRTGRPAAAVVAADQQGGQVQ